MQAAQAVQVAQAAQVALPPIDVLLGLQGSRNPFSGCASYQAIATLPLA